MSDRPAPSEIAGRYRVVRELGAGAFGTVYEAKDSVLGRAVAIKTIRAETLAAAGSGAGELLERFRREAQVAARLRHPNVVTIYDVGQADGVSYLAMELIEGEPLDLLMAQEGRLPVRRAAAIAAQVAEALGYAHDDGVVHRDVKPANIMVEPGDRVKVTDFGIAKARAADRLTVTGTLIGTPAYMSPEQARGGDLDGRSDLFSLGCVLYEMLTGRRAFEGDSITGLIFKVITEQPVSVRVLAPDVPLELVRLVDATLHKQREGRHASGRQLARELLCFAGPGAATTVPRGDPAPAPRSGPETGPGSAPDGPATTRALPGSAVRGVPPVARSRRRRAALAIGLPVVLVAVVAAGMLLRARGRERVSAGPVADATATTAAPRPSDDAPAATPAPTKAPAVTATPSPAHDPATPPAMEPGVPATTAVRPPAELGGAELAAWKTVGALIDAQRRFRARHGRYGELNELAAARLLPGRRVQHARRFYLFELSVDADAFEVVASPRSTGPRSFVGDETGVIRTR